MVKDCVVAKTFCTTMVKGRPSVTKKNTSQEIPMAKATGIPNNKNIMNTIVATPILLVSPSLLPEGHRFLDDFHKADAGRYHH